MGGHRVTDDERLDRALGWLESAEKTIEAVAQGRVATDDPSLQEAGTQLQRVGEALRASVDAEVGQEMQDLALLNSLNYAANQGQSLDDLIDLLAEGTKRIFACRGATVYLLSKDGKYLVLPRRVRLPAPLLRRIEKVFGKIPTGIKIALDEQSLYREMLEKSEPTLISEPDAIDRLVAEFTPSKALKKLAGRARKILGIRSVIGVPLVAQGQTIGFLDASRGEPFTESDVRRFQIVSEQVTSVLQHRRTDEALEESELKYRSLVENLDDIIFTLDLEGRFTYISPAVERMYQRKVSEFVGHLMDEFVHPDDLDVAQAALERAVAGEVKPTEFRVVDRDGTLRHVRSLSRLLVEDGQPVGVTGVLSDITSRKRAEQLRTAAYRISRAANLAESLEELFATIDEIIGELMPAQSFYIAQYDAEAEMIHFPYFRDVHDEAPASRRFGKGLTEYVLRTAEPLLASREVLEELASAGEIELIGGVVPQDWLGVPLRVQDETIGVLVVQGYVEGGVLGEDEKDILTFVSTQVAIAMEGQRAEDALRARTEELDLLYEAGRQLSGTLDLHKVYDALYGVVDKVMPCDSLVASSYDADERLIRCVYARHRGEPLDVAQFPPIPLNPEGRGTQSVAIQTGEPLLIRDYEARRKTSQTSYFVSDDGEVSEEVPEDADITRSAMVVPLKLKERVVGVVQVLSNRLDSYSKDDLHVLEGLAQQVAAASANAMLYQQAQDEITERKQAEEALRESESRYRSLFEDSPVALWHEDWSGIKAYLDDLRDSGATDYREFFQEHPEATKRCTDLLTVLDMNDAAAALYEAKDRDELRTGLGQIIAEQEEPTFALQVVALAEGALRFRAEVATRTLMGGKMQLEAHLAVVPGHEESLDRVLVSCVDITERKRAEQERELMESELHQAQKLEAVALLAGGVAHEFNNMLTVIQGNAELAQMALEPSHALQSELTAILQAARRSADLTQQLLAFGRRRMLRPQMVEVNEVIRKLARMLERVIGEQIALRLDLAMQLGAVWADPGALQQVLMNLVLNARDAMPDGGELRLETAQVSVDEAYCQSRPEAEPGEYVRVAVADAGAGMDEVTKEHLFEPFFTTKGVGEGNGLGLSVVYGLVREHGGWIEVESELGKGTRFEVYLPVGGRT